MQISKDKPLYHHMKYSLKMALRMINGSFEGFELYNFSNSGVNLDEESEKNVIEAWYIADPHSEKQIMDGTKIPLEHQTGSIVKNPSDIRLNQTLTFFFFKVVVGRAYVLKESDLKKQEEEGSFVLPNNYDSLYIQESNSDYMRHCYRVFDKEKVRLLYKVTTSIKIKSSGIRSNPICRICDEPFNEGVGQTASSIA